MLRDQRGARVRPPRMAIQQANAQGYRLLATCGDREPRWRAGNARENCRVEQLCNSLSPPYHRLPHARAERRHSVCSNGQLANRQRQKQRCRAGLPHSAGTTGSRGERPSGRLTRAPGGAGTSPSRRGSSVSRIQRSRRARMSASTSAQAGSSARLWVSWGSKTRS